MTDSLAAVEHGDAAIRAGRRTVMMVDLIDIVDTAECLPILAPTKVVALREREARGLTADGRHTRDFIN